jgi:hypothetical protein
MVLASLAGTARADGIYEGMDLEGPLMMLVILGGTFVVAMLNLLAKPSDKKAPVKEQLPEVVTARVHRETSSS